MPLLNDVQGWEDSWLCCPRGVLTLLSRGAKPLPAENKPGGGES